MSFLPEHSARIVELQRQLAERDAHIAQLDHAMQKRVESEARYRLLVENLPAVAWSTDVHGGITYIGPNVQRVYGFSPREIYAGGLELWLDRIHPDDVGGVRQAFAELVAQGIGYDAEYRIQRKDGAWIWLHDRAARIEDVDGVRHANGVFWDVTERKDAERAQSARHGRLRALSKHQHELREAEQKHISRELHDELGSTLTALRMDLSWLEARLPSDSLPLRERLVEMERLVEDLNERVRLLASELRPGLLDHLGIGAATQWLITRICGRAGLKCSLRLEPEDLRLDEPRSIALYRVLQEALTNVVRHAQAQHLDVLIRRDGDGVELQVHDDGIGFVPESEARVATFGLLGIRERVGLLGGVVEIRSAPGQGTRLNVIFEAGAPPEDA